MSEGGKTPEAVEQAEAPATPGAASEQDSKEQAPAEDGASSAKSKTPSKDTPAPSSKPGSPKSKPGSAKSGTSMRSVSSAKSKGSRPKSSARSASAKKKSKKKDEFPPPPPEDDGPLPEGCLAIFLSSQTQEIFSIRGDEDVTAEQPYKLIKKEDLQTDFFKRAAVSDFTPIKQIILDFPEDEMLLVYDADFRHGQNFYIATTLEAKQKILFRAESVDGEVPGGHPEEEEEEDEDIVYKYVPPVAKEWVSLGSEKEIDSQPVIKTPKITMSIKRKRRDFGAPILFEDLNVADSKTMYFECTPFEDKTYDIKRLELDKGTQSIPIYVDQSCQTDWKFPRNANTQYEVREFSNEQLDELLKTDALAKFASDALPRLELVVQQNKVVDIFHDDWMALADDDSTFGSKADNHLKEYQSFTDLQFSKDKTITWIEWHPTIRGIVAVAVAERLSFDERIENAARVIMTPSLILIWSFTDPIHPQLLLEAPDDIQCFKFCPTDSNILAGGCINGQVVLWDISNFTDRLKTQRGGNKKKNNLHTLPGFEDENAMETPIVRYCAVSSIEHSHRAPITDIQWMPDHIELSRMGIPQENRSGNCVQLMTSATDHCILVWDIRPPKTQQQQPSKKKDEITNPMGVPTTFKHLDLTWKPHLKVNLMKSEPGGDHSPTKFTIQERQGDHTVSADDVNDTPNMDKRGSTAGFNFTGAKPGSAGAKKTLTAVNTHFYVGTEDGEIVYVDWMPQKDQDTGKIQTPKPAYYHSLHDGPIVSLQRAPFFKDIVLCVGGWTFSIWKEGVTTGPILQSSSSNRRLTAGHWSPSRPAVFYITKNDGTVDVWDLLDRTHEASMSQSISPLPITCIFPYQVTTKQHLLAVGDMSGTLHILEIPWSLRQPTHNELTGMSNYFEREVKRRVFVVERWDYREKEKIKIENEAKMKAGIAPNVTLSEEEIKHRMKMEYAAYLETEAAFLRSLGLMRDDDDLPATE